MQNENWITRKIDIKNKILIESHETLTRNCKKYITPVEYYRNLPQSKGLEYAFSGCKEIHPCVLQDIGPLGPLPCSHSTFSANHSKQGIGYR